MSPTAKHNARIAAHTSSLPTDRCNTLHRRLTVVQLLPALHAGGVERSTLEIAAALVKAGHRAIVVSAGGRLVPALEASGATHLTLNIGRKTPATLRHIKTLRALFQHERPDIVHARSRLPAWIGWAALRLLPKQNRPHFVTTVHGLNSPSVYSGIMTRGERVICVSKTVQRYVLQHYLKTNPACLRVIPRGIDPAQFPYVAKTDRSMRQQIARQFPQLAGDGPLLLLPGRGTRLKGHHDGLQLLATLRANGLDARLWLPGSRAPGREAYIAELEQLAAQLGIRNFVAFTPATSQIAQAYAACDLVLQLSRKPEAFGRTVIEALSVGRFVLGWAHGGVGELLVELQPVGAVTPFDAEALAVTAQNLLKMPAPPPADMPYTLAAMQQATLSLYQEIVSS